MLSIGYNVHLWLSLFIILAMLVSALASLTLVPGLVLSLRPAFIFGRASGGTKALVTASMLMLAVGAVGASPTIARAEALTASSIMEKSLSATKVRDSIADATFTLINKDGEERVRRTNGYTKLQDNGSDNMRTVRFLSPSDIKGTATLLIEHASGDDDMWIYLPALKKVRRLVASNKKDSFVGTEFSYGDVIGHRTSDWTHRILREETVAGAPTYVIESLPRNGEVKNNTGYSKRVSWVRKDNFIAVRTDFWDIGGQPLKTVTAGEIKAVGTNSKWQPMVSEAVNLQNGRKTVIRFEEFKADQNLSDNYFNPRSLER
jgi:outer membrane lipoprotein-sorting protein